MDKDKIDHPFAQEPENVERAELDPKCFDRRQEAYAITNRMELIPCCWLDNQINRKDIEYGQLLLASRIYDYDSIDEILLTDEWIEFYENLGKGKGFPMCHIVCKKRETPQHKKETFYKDGKLALKKET